MNIHDFLTEDCVSFIDAEDKHQVIEQLIEAAAGLGKLRNKESFRRAVKDRENIMSTGLGLGIAVPHAKLADIDGFFVMTAVLSKGIEWDAIDKQPVFAVFLIGGPENRQTEYLQILSKLVLMAKNSKRRESLIGAKTAAQVADLFRNV